MSKPINEKCLDCALNYKRDLRKTNVNYKPEPSCWAGKPCYRKRTYYRRLEEYRKKQRDYHRYLREKGDCCHICKRIKDLEVHHVKPQSIGGVDHKSNLMTLCKKCHRVITNYYKTLGWYEDNSILRHIKDIVSD